MSKLYTIKHDIRYTKTSDTYKSNLSIVNKATLLHIAKMYGVKLPKSHTKEKMGETLSAFVLSNPRKCLEKLSVKELEVLKDFVKVGANTHVVRPSRKFYKTMRSLLLVSVCHNKKERRLYFLLPDELRELFAPLLDKALKEARKREKEQKAAAPKPPVDDAEEPEYIDDDELFDSDFDDDWDEEDDEDVFDGFETFLESLDHKDFLKQLVQQIHGRAEADCLSLPSYKYSCSVDLMEAVRKQPYEKKVEICKTFQRLIERQQVGGNTVYTERFEEDFDMIDFFDDNDEDAPHYIGYCINDLDNAISEIDYYDPMTFFRIAGELDKVIMK